MLHPLEERRLKTIDELFDSNYKILYDEYENEIFKHNPKYQRAFNDERIVVYEFFDANILKDDKVVFSYPCSLFDKFSSELSDNVLYSIAESFNGQRLQIYTGPFSPYLNKFKILMDLSFEAGLPKAWKIFNDDEISRLNLTSETEQNKQNEILNLSLIGPFFIILLFGFSAALFVLCCEIFYHDFLSKLTKEILKIDAKFLKLFKRKKDKNVRIKKNVNLTI